MFLKKSATLLILGVASLASSYAADLPPRASALCPPGKNGHPARTRVSVRAEPPSSLPAPISLRAPLLRESHGSSDTSLHASGASGVSWGPTPGIGQLGTVADSYIAVSHCLVPQPIFDDFGVFVGQHLVDICLEMHP